jgi:hypothetical protein
MQTHLIPSDVKTISKVRASNHYNIYTVGTVSEEVAMRDWWPGLGIPAARLARRRAAAGVSREQGGGRDEVNLQLVYSSLAVQPL